MKTRFLAPARNELQDAINYYNKQREGLGFQFSDEVKRALRRVLQYPEAWSRLSDSTRRCRVKRFPYNVVYYIRGNELIVVAIMHGRREPNYWQGRIT